MKDILHDILDHTQALGFIEIIKIVSNESSTNISALAEDRSVAIFADTIYPIKEFIGTFGMPNLSHLNTLLKIPEYKENAKLSLNIQERNGEIIPVGIHFENFSSDFQNDYRFMSAAIIKERLKTVKFKDVDWKVNKEPTVKAILRFSYQALANSDEHVFIAKTEKNNLIFEFGDHSTHAGEFIFLFNIENTLSQTWSYPVNQTLKILKLTGDKRIMFSNEGAMQITVNSGLIKYSYIIPAQTK